MRTADSTAAQLQSFRSRCPHRARHCVICVLFSVSVSLLLCDTVLWMNHLKCTVGTVCVNERVLDILLCKVMCLTVSPVVVSRLW